MQAAPDGAELARSEAAHLLGEFSALLGQVGLPAEPSAPADYFGIRSIETLADLTRLIEAYFAQVLLPLELPAVAEACRYAQRGETRELLGCDQQLSPRLDATPFAAPSRQIGRLQLARMRPLRDDRTVRRYLAAVEAGDAGGWHPLVYGLTLAVYSLPLRQGLLFYGRETLLGMAQAAATARQFPEADVLGAVEPLLCQVPAAVDNVLSSTAALRCD